MAKSIATGYTDTAISGNPAMTVTVGKLNFGVDYLVQPGSSTSEVNLVNATSPRDQQETIRFAQKSVKDIYTGTDIESDARVSVKGGLDTLLELRGVWLETDSVDATYRKLIPYKVGLQFRMPNYSSVTPAMALAQVLRAYGLAFETGTTTEAGINRILHSNLMKADL